MKIILFFFTTAVTLGTVKFSNAQTLPSYLPTEGLVGWWPFNGNANDESGNGNLLSNYFVQFTTDNQRGPVANFNGNSWLESDTSVFHSATPITFCFWAKTNSNYSMDIIRQACGNECGDDLRVQLNAAQCGYTGLSFKSPAFFASAPGDISDANWHFFTLVMGSNNNLSYSNFQFYIDGIFVAIGPSQCSHNWGGWTYNPNTTYPLSIGKGGPSDSYFNGSLDDIALYTRSLSTQEIITLYNSSNINSSFGCTHAAACNYNPLAINDDGSCVYPSQPFLSCSGECLNDTDSDGICDELESGSELSNYSSTPQAISYQACARDGQGQAYNNIDIQVRFTLLADSLTGTSEYSELHSLTTNDLGLFTTAFGTGTPLSGTFPNINWAGGNKYLKVEMDAGNGFVALGTQQLLSVPYSMRSQTSAAIQNNALPVYSNNAAALAGGLQAGQMYRTATGDLKIVY